MASETKSCYRIELSIPIAAIDDVIAFSYMLSDLVEAIDGITCPDSGIGFGYRDLGFKATGAACCIEALRVIESELSFAGVPVNDGEGSAQLHSHEES